MYIWKFQAGAMLNVRCVHETFMGILTTMAMLNMT